MKKTNNPISRTRGTNVWPSQWAALLKTSPLSPGTKTTAHIHAFTVTCTIKNKIRDNPVTAITNFFPTDEVKNSDHFINQAELKIMQRITFGAAKIASERQMKEKVS